MSPHKAQLERKLWSVADQLRGQMDASEYQKYALGVIFYKYLSEVTEQKVYKLLDRADKERINTGELTVAQAWVEDPQKKDILDTLIFKELGYRLEPQYLYSQALTEIEKGSQGQWSIDWLASALNQIINSTVGADSHEAFKGLFDDLNLNSPSLGATADKRAHRLGGILKQIGEIDFRLEDTEIDVLGDAYEYMIGQFASGAGKKGGEFYTPQDVSTIVSKILTHEKPDLASVYDPTCGSGSLLLRMVRESDREVRQMLVYGQEWNTTTYNLARMNMILHGVPWNHFHVKNGDTLTDDKFPDKQFDVIGANPPYSLAWEHTPTLLTDPRFSAVGKLAPKNKADFAFVQHIVHHLSDDGGTAAVVLPHGVLFRGGAEASIRKHLLEQNLVHAVIGLPGNLFYGTSIPTFILVLKKGREADAPILFVDASSKFVKGKNQNQLGAENVTAIFEAYTAREDQKCLSALVSLETVRENDYNLNIPRYVDTAGEEEVIDLVAVRASIVAQEELIRDLSQQIEEQVAQLHPVVRE